MSFINQAAIRKLVLEAHCGDDVWIPADAIAIAVQKDDLEIMCKRLASVQRLKREDINFYGGQWFSYNWFVIARSFTDDSIPRRKIDETAETEWQKRFDANIEPNIQNGNYAIFADNLEIPELAIIKTECCTVTVTDTKFIWKCYLKHASARIGSSTLPVQYFCEICAEYDICPASYGVVMP